jgi:hypothetical protein
VTLHPRQAVAAFVTAKEPPDRLDNPEVHDDRKHEAYGDGVGWHTLILAPTSGRTQPTTNIPSHSN